MSIPLIKETWKQEDMSSFTLFVSLWTYGMKWNNIIHHVFVEYVYFFLYASHELCLEMERRGTALASYIRGLGDFSIWVLSDGRERQTPAVVFAGVCNLLSRQATGSRREVTVNCHLPYEDFADSSLTRRCLRPRRRTRLWMDVWSAELSSQGLSLNHDWGCGDKCASFEQLSSVI